MSTTRGAVKLEARSLINDLSVSDPAVAEQRWNAIIQSNMDQFMVGLAPADTWTANAITLVAGTVDYTMSAGEYQSLALLRRSDDHVVLFKRTEEYLRALDQSSVASQGKPTDFALYEDASGVLQVRVWPAPTAAGNLDAFLALNNSALTADASTISVSRVGARVLALWSAAEALAGLDAELCAKLHIAPSFAGVLRSRGDALYESEGVRQTQFQRTDHIERVVY